jgi:Helix-turn-helix domain
VTSSFRYGSASSTTGAASPASTASGRYRLVVSRTPSPIGIQLRHSTMLTRRGACRAGSRRIDAPPPLTSYPSPGTVTPDGDNRVIHRAYKFRAYPTRRQEQHARALLEAHRQLYNAALEERREAWRRGVTIGYAHQSAQLVEIRKADRDGQGRWSFTSQQQTLRRLDRAFQGFFQRVRAGRRAGYPRFKTAARWDSVDFVDRDGARWRAVEGRWAAAYFQGVGQVKVKAHREVVGRVKTLRCKRERRRWYVIVVAEQQPAPLPATGREISLDVGIARFATLRRSTRAQPAVPGCDRG